MCREPDGRTVSLNGKHSGLNGAIADENVCRGFLVFLFLFAPCLKRTPGPMTAAGGPEDRSGELQEHSFSRLPSASDGGGARTATASAPATGPWRPPMFGRTPRLSGDDEGMAGKHQFQAPGPGRKLSLAAQILGMGSCRRPTPGIRGTGPFPMGTICAGPGPRPRLGRDSTSTTTSGIPTPVPSPTT